jgi:hypothetical protein
MKNIIFWDVMPRSLADVLEESKASIFRVQEKPNKHSDKSDGLHPVVC